MVTQASCKITNCLLIYYEKQGISPAPLFEIFDGPEEFLRDSHFWLELSKVERLLERASRAFEDNRFGATLGSQVVELQALGALDSVFRLMPSTKDYYANLGRFFSYFLAPLDEFKPIEVKDTFVRFRFPISRKAYPQVFDFLRGVLENLPRYTGHLPCGSDWSDEKEEMFLNWDTAQPSLFLQEPDHVVSPKLVKNLMSLLETNEKLLEEKNREIQQLKTDLRTQLKDRVYAEKMAGLAQLAAGIAHEINNPLSYVVSNLGRFGDYFQRLQTYILSLESQLPHRLEALKSELDIDFIFSEFPSMLRETGDGLKRVKEIVKDLSSLAHPRTGRDEEKMLVDLNGILESSIKVFSDQIADRIDVIRSLDLRAPVNVFPVKMSQVFMNLLSNAIHAIDEKGVIEVRTRQYNDRAVVEILDSGAGMDEAMLEKIFTPFFTTKEVGRGTGLGLSIAQSIVEMHKGQIDVKSEKGKGSQFTVTLPIH